MYFRVVNYAALKRSEHLELLKEKDNKITFLSFELEQLKRALFGSKSERFVPATANPEQLALFKELEKQIAELQKESITYSRKKVKRKPKRTKLPEDLERVVTILEPEVDTTGMRKMGNEIKEKLAFVPAKLYVEQTLRTKYKDERGVFYIADLPSDPFPKSIASESLAAHIAVSKYVDHQPLYRQSKILARQSIDLPRSTMCGIIRRGADLIKPIYYAMIDKAMKSDYLMADESSIPVLRKDEQNKKTIKGCMLVKVAPEAKITVMEYIMTKEKVNIVNALKSFKGHLQVDGNVSYEELSKIGQVYLMHCLVHSRRYFEKALDYDQGKANVMLNMIQKLYQIERSCNGQSFELILQTRKQHAIPVLDKMKKWLDANLAMNDPPNPIQKAIRYMLKRWNGLTEYVNYGHLRPDNNLIENQIRPLALGRKNYLFAGSDNGAEHAAIFYSMFSTCAMNNINPFDWLVDVFKRISDHHINKIDQLIPVENYQFLVG